MTFRSKFLSHSIKRFVEEHFGVSENFGHRKILYLRGVCHDFLSKNFCLTVTKDSLRNTSVFQKISGIEKFYT